MATSSATEKENLIHHSGAGRICKLEMETMSLFESGDSSGSISLKDMFLNKSVKNHVTQELSLKDLANLILKGGLLKVISKIY